MGQWVAGYVARQYTVLANGHLSQENITLWMHHNLTDKDVRLVTSVSGVEALFQYKIFTTLFCLYVMCRFVYYESIDGYCNCTDWIVDSSHLT